GEIIATAEQAPRVLHAHAIDDRAVDLWTPLLTVALVADAEDGATVARAARILAVARELSDARDAGEAEGTTARLLAALESVRASRGERLTPSELLAALRGEGLEWIKSTRALAGLLAPLGLVSRSARGVPGRKGTTRAYPLDADLLTDLIARYGAADGG